MKLPNGERAVVDIVKLTDYCLDPNHPRGKHKARVFEAACGITVHHAESLRQQLLDAAEHADAVPADSLGFGARYVIELTVQGPSGSALVRSAWIVRQGEDFPASSAPTFCDQVP